MKTLVLFFAGLAFVSQATAFGWLADIQIMDRTTGTTLQVYEHEGRRYVAGEPGHEYQMSVTSREGARLLAVGSVDGVNIVSGETAAVNQDGYVLAPWQQMLIAGWRTSLDNTAAFYFTTVADSYAARTGRPDDLGVIGIALFREKVRCCALGRRDESRERGATDKAAEPDAAAAPSASESGKLAKKDDRLGTGYGRTEYSQVVYTEFERASNRPAEVVTIYYDSYENLRRQGVIPGVERPHEQRPRPFPGGFVPAP